MPPGFAGLAVLLYPRDCRTARPVPCPLISMDRLAACCARLRKFTARLLRMLSIWPEPMAAPTGMRFSCPDTCDDGRVDDLREAVSFICTGQCGRGTPDSAAPVRQATPGTGSRAQA